MKRAILAAAAAAAALTGLGASAASAQVPTAHLVLVGNDDWDDYLDDQRDAYREYSKDQRKAERDMRKADRDLARAERKYYRAQARYARGQYLPASYRSSRYVVRDYRAYHLAPPPAGYAYYRNDNDIFLTSVASGLITSVLADVLR